LPQIHGLEKLLKLKTFLLARNNYTKAHSLKEYLRQIKMPDNYNQAFLYIIN